MVLSILPTAALAEGPATSGKYDSTPSFRLTGNQGTSDISWRFDPASGTLTVTHNAICNHGGGCSYVETEDGYTYSFSCLMTYPTSAIVWGMPDPRPWSHWEEDVRRVVLEGPITDVAEGAFRDLPNLREVVIPEGVISIGCSAFENCTALEHVTFPEHPIAFTGYATENTEHVFRYCTALNMAQLESIATTATQNLPNGAVLSADGTTLLRAAPGMESIPDTVTEIGHGAFWGVSGVRHISLPDRVTSVGAQAFARCPDLVSVSLPDSVTLATPPVKPYSADKEAETGYTPGAGLGGKSVLMGSVTLGDELLSAEVFKASPKLQPVIFRPTDQRSQFAERFSLHLDYNLTPGQDITLIGFSSDMHTDMGGNWKITAGLDPSKFVLPQNERITALSDTICDGITDPYDKAKAIFTWVANNIVYDDDYYDGRKDTVTILPDEVLDSRLTICDGYTRLTQALLQAQGIPAVYIGGSAFSGGYIRHEFPDGTIELEPRKEGHAWNAAYINGNWVYIDSTWGRPQVTNRNTGEVSAGLNPDQFDLSLSALSEKRFGEDYTADAYARYTYEFSTDFSRTVTPNRATVLVNGEKVDFEAYTVNGNNYFKLRDVAQALTGSGKQFEVTWDMEKSAINLISGRPYTTVGGELVPGDGTDKTADPNAPAVYVDGALFFLGAYAINGNNYVKLRDLGRVLDFNVSWDNANQTIVINTNESYTAD